MSDLLLHPRTQEQLNTLMGHKPHGILITGAHGSGKKTLARFAACTILHTQNLDSYPYYLQILPDGLSISIDSIRKIKAFLSRKTTGTAEIRRIVLIGDTHSMTSEAQNALLKILEEPPADTMLILTSNDINALKPTIVSRVQHLSVMPVTKQAAIESLKNGDVTESAVIAAYHMSGGNAGLMVALLNQKDDHEMVQAISMAKDFLRMDTYHRLLQTDGLSKQKEQLGLLIVGLQRVVASGLEQAALKDSQAQVKKFHELSNHLQEAKSALSKNASAKLVLDNLFLQM